MSSYASVNLRLCNENHYKMHYKETPGSKTFKKKLEYTDFSIEKEKSTTT